MCKKQKAKRYFYNWLLAPNLISNKRYAWFFFCTCRSQLLWLSLSRRGKRPSPFLDLMNCFHFQTYFSNRYCLRNSAFPWGFDTVSWPVVIKIFIHYFIKKKLRTILLHWYTVYLFRRSTYLLLGDTFSMPHMMLWGPSWARVGPGHGFHYCRAWLWSGTQ